MRKTAMKKKRSREAFLAARNTPGAIKHIYTEDGKLVALNTAKHALMMEEYRKDEYSKEMIRDFVNKIKDLESKKQPVQAEAPLDKGTVILPAAAAKTEGDN